MPETRSTIPAHRGPWVVATVGAIVVGESGGDAVVKAGRKYRVDEVFGMSREVPLNYGTRQKVDGLLVETLTRDKHLAVFGSSKQGKTCLRKYNLKPHEYVVVTCSNRWSLRDLHTAVLKQAGYTIEQSATRTASGANKISAKTGGRFRFGIVEAELGGSAETETGESSQVVEIAGC
jgi:hypothetical protein